MKYSVRAIQKYLEPPPGAEEIADILTNCGLEVEFMEEWSNFPGTLENFVVARVIEVKPHPNADRLKCTLVDAGEGRLRSVVCGAPNVAPGQVVILAKENAEIRIPGKDPFTIQKAKIRGEISEGMICAADEIGIGKDHEGIFILDNTFPPGTPASEVFAVWKDIVLFINVTPNRPDATSHRGLARDIYSVLKGKKKKVILTEKFEIPVIKTGRCPIPFKIESPEACYRYAGALVKNVQIGPSPQWLKNTLESCGIKSINNAVDIANYVMIETGQPLHFFDAKKIQGKVIIRKANSNEKMSFLDGKERTFLPDDLVIADESRPLCLAGILGGSHSAVTEETTEIFIESAWFHPSIIRKSVKGHQIHTEASYRFERHTDPEGCLPALSLAIKLLQELCKAQMSGEPEIIITKEYVSEPIAVNTRELNAFLGTDLDEKDMVDILRNLGFKISPDEEHVFLVFPPSFKPDIKRWQDVAEEIIRIIGFDSIHRKPKICFSITHKQAQSSFSRNRELAKKFSNLGFIEIITYPMVDPIKIMDTKRHVHLLNPISSEMAVLRHSLCESMLSCAEYNLHRQQINLRLFEIGKVFGKENQNITETDYLGILICGNRFPESWYYPQSEVDIFTLKQAVQYVSPFYVEWVESQSDDNLLQPVYELHVKNQKVGKAGMLHKDLLQRFHLIQNIFFAELNLEMLFNNFKISKSYRTPPRFPEVRRDLAFLIPKNVPFKNVEEIVRRKGGNLLQKIVLFDVFDGKNLPEGLLSIAIALTFRHPDRTLTDQEINQIIQEIVQSVTQSCQAQLRS